MNPLDDVSRRFINRFQGGFPLVSRPFGQVAATLGIGEAALISRVRSLVEDGYLSRFGPLYHAPRLGGAQILAAMRVPLDRFETVAVMVNAEVAVAHNYRRDHPLNMWFVIAVDRPAALDEVVGRIETATGLEVWRFPKIREFHVGLWLRLDDHGGVDTVPVQAIATRPGYRIDAFDRDLLRASQAGLPLDIRPFDHLARQLDASEARVMERFQAMLDHGVVRRIGAIPNHYRLGLVANGMTVWDIDDARIEVAGRMVAALPFVSHCYQRPRQPGVWNYNLFAMLHGARPGAVEARRREVADVLGDACRGGEVLASTAILKKTGLRLAA